MFGYCCCAYDEGKPEVVGALAVHAEHPFEQDPPTREECASDQVAPFDYVAKLRLQAADGNLGMSYLCLPNFGMFVSNLSANGSGAVPEYNQRVPADQRIAKYDRIVSVNGAQTADEISQAFVSEKELNLAMRRPRVFEETVASNGKPWGLTLRRLNSSGGWLVIGVAQDSAIAASGADLRVGDRIVKTNGVESSASDRMDEMKSTSPVVVTIARA